MTPKFLFGCKIANSPQYLNIVLPTSKIRVKCSTISKANHTSFGILILRRTCGHFCVDQNMQPFLCQYYNVLSEKFYLVVWEEDWHFNSLICRLTFIWWLCLPKPWFNVFTLIKHTRYCKLGLFLITWQVLLVATQVKTGTPSTHSFCFSISLERFIVDISIYWPRKKY